MPITVHQELVESENRYQYTIIEMLPDFRMLGVPAYRVERKFQEKFESLAVNHREVDFDPTCRSGIYVHKWLAPIAKLSVIYRERVYMKLVIKLDDWNLLDRETGQQCTLRASFRPWRFRKVRNSRIRK